MKDMKWDKKTIEGVREVVLGHFFSGYGLLNDVEDEIIEQVIKEFQLPDNLSVALSEGSEARASLLRSMLGKQGKIEKLIGTESVSPSVFQKGIEEIIALLIIHQAKRSASPHPTQHKSTIASAVASTTVARDEHAGSTEQKDQSAQSTFVNDELEAPVAGASEIAQPSEMTSSVETGDHATSESVTKRFDKYHRSWAGNALWKKDDAEPSGSEKEVLFGVDLDCADDDDYLSAWLECLRLGVPWGGRGAGGRGLQRVTGESKDILVHNVTITRGTNELLDSSVLKLNDGIIYGLIGRNGSGKTTLIKRIAMGRLPGFPPWLKVHHVQQELKLEGVAELASLCPVAFVLKFDHQRTALFKEESSLLEALETSSSPEKQERLNEVYALLDQIDAYAAEFRAEEALKTVGFTKQLLATEMQHLSGGWRMKACLAAVVFTEPDVLLLDEPTNHLDIYAVKWLETFLRSGKFTGTVLLISHDRSFINNCCDELILLRKKKLSYFAGNYAEYLAMKEQKRQMETRKSDAMDIRKAELKKFITATQQSAHDRKSKGGDAKKQKQIRSRKKKLDRIERIGFGTATGHRYRDQVDKSPHSYKVHLPQAIDFDEKPLHFCFPEVTMASKSEAARNEVVLQLNNLNCSFNDHLLFSSFTAQVSRTSKIGIIGRNGCGKSSLLRAIVDHIRQHRSDKVVYDSRLKVGYFSQDMVTTIEQTISPCDLLLKKSMALKTAGLVSDFIYLDTVDKARQYLGKFGIQRDQGIRHIETLSGGQKSRVLFASECLTRPDLLIMDEPSNHLDITSVEVLAKAICDFQGAVLLVSHDRSLLSECVDEIWHFPKKSTTITVSKRSPEESRGEFLAKYFR